MDKSIKDIQREMKYIWSIVSNVQLLNVVSLVCGDKLYDHSAADSNCLNYGGLLPNADVIATGYMTTDSMPPDSAYLQDGESAWISGYVEYSNFTNWQGCYKEKGVSIFKNSLEKNGIKECLKYCIETARRKVTYIGIEKTNCYCLKNTDIQDTVEAISDTECTHQEPYNIKFNFTGSSSSKSIETISVYQVFSPTLNSSQNLRQCLYGIIAPDTTEYGTSSCYANRNQVKRFICMNGANNRLNNTCEDFQETSSEQPAMCIEHESTNWIMANKRCRDISGKLSDHTLFASIRTNLDLKEKYWTGLFRTFEVKSRKTAVCLAVTKINNKFILDPDDCLEKKKYICKVSASSTGSITTASTVSITSPVVTGKDPVIEKTSTEKNSTNHKWLYIVVAVASVGFIAIIVCIAVRRFKKKSEHQRLPENASTSFNNEGDTPADVSTAKEDCDCSAEPELRNNGKKIKPKKPIRQTLRKQNCNTSYENFKLNSEASGDTDEISDRKVREDYDKVDLKGGKMKLLDDNEMDESHIYDHTTVEEDAENYDTIKSKKSRQQLDSITYSTLQRKSEKANNASEKNKQISDIENEKDTRSACEETQDNNAYDAIGEIKTNKTENALPSEAEAEQLIDIDN